LVRYEIQNNSHLKCSYFGWESLKATQITAQQPKWQYCTAHNISIMCWMSVTWLVPTEMMKNSVVSFIVLQFFCTICMSNSFTGKRIRMGRNLNTMPRNNMKGVFYWFFIFRFSFMKKWIQIWKCYIRPFTFTSPLNFTSVPCHHVWIEIQKLTTLWIELQKWKTFSYFHMYPKITRKFISVQIQKLKRFWISGFWSK
jgi:hypothetical protein